MRTVEHTREHYEVQEVEFGEVYRWCPESIVAECDCGERPTLTRSMTACGGCGADHAVAVREELDARRLADEVAHPWRYTGDAGAREDDGMPY